jgi:hypothetical protein
MTSTTTDAPETASEPSDDWVCDRCGEPTTPPFALHGECLLRREFGGIAEIVTPEDVGDSLDADAGMTPRQSGLAVEVLIDQSTADRVLRRAHLETLSLDERREMRAYLVAHISDNFGPLEEISPKSARELRIKHATAALVQLVTASKDEDEDEDEDEDDKAEPEAEAEADERS